ncbi:MAG: VanZ family protein [Porcipelethomonas sp.]
MAIFILPVLICMGIIFYCSSQDSQQTNILSFNVTNKIARIIFTGFSSMSVNVQNIITSGLNHFIRKAAHLSVYFLLGASVYAAAVIFIRRYLAGGVISTAVCIIYAALDEFHQSFVPGRTPLVRDIFIDTAGAVLGAAACFVIISVVCHIKRLMKKNNSSRRSAS